MIPKIIHFVWVGNAPKPDLVQRCMASWTTHCPDYEVVEWGNAELAQIDNVYVKEAAAAGKWAFVSDYIRLFALYEKGGFYVDTDLELTAPLEAFRAYDFLMGFERTSDGKRVRPSTALIASQPKNPIIESLLKEYDGIHFVKNGVPVLTTNTDRITRHLRRYFGLTKSKFGKGENTVFLDKSSVIFPYFFFSRTKPGNENYAIHHFIGSWLDPGKRKTVASVGEWLLLKFTFEEEDPTVPLADGEELIWHISHGGKRSRALALVRRKSK